MNFFIFATIILIMNQEMLNVVAKKGKIFDMCSLTKELHRLGVPRTELPDWICIALHESSYNTKAIHVNRDKSQNWGLFQINDKHWCQPVPRANDIEQHLPKSSNLCEISCQNLIADDITATVECARFIKETASGFSNWPMWRKKCQYHKPTINKCFY